MNEDPKFGSYLGFSKENLCQMTEAEREQSNVALVRLFMELNRVIKPSLILEIGAYNAAFSIEAKKLLQNTRVVAFEASPYNFQHFKDHVNIRTSGIEYLHLAITEQTGVAEFQIQTKIDDEDLSPIRANNSLLARTEAGVLVKYQKVIVPTLSLNEYILQNNLAGMSFTAWVDVEGALEGVLKGGSQVWKECAAIFIEVEEHKYWETQWLYSDVVSYLTASGFTPAARDFEYIDQYNVIFIRNENLLCPEIRAIINGHTL